MSLYCWSIQLTPTWFSFSKPGTLRVSKQRKGTEAQFHILGGYCSFPHTSPHPSSQLLTTVRDNPSSWWTGGHPSAIIYKSFLPWLGHLTSLASISGTREPARTCCSILSVQLDLAYCMGGEAYYLGAENLVTPSQFSTFSWAILRLTSLWFMPATCVFISGLSSEPVVQLDLPFHPPRL